MEIINQAEHQFLSLLHNCSYRSQAVGIVHGLDGISSCLTLKLFPSLAYGLSFSGLNLLFSAMSFILTIWGWIAIKDTDGLSLSEIEHIYDQRLRHRPYGDEKEGSSDYNQVGSEQELQSKVSVMDPNVCYGYDTEPESLMSLPWITK